MQARLEIVRTRLANYRKAEEAILRSQSYSIEGLNLTRANLADVQKTIKQLEQEEAQLASGRSRARTRVIVPGW